MLVLFFLIWLILPSPTVKADPAELFLNLLNSDFLTAKILIEEGGVDGGAGRPCGLRKRARARAPGDATPDGGYRRKYLRESP